jgi:hypothetical protein
LIIAASDVAAGNAADTTTTCGSNKPDRQIIRNPKPNPLGPIPSTWTKTK